MTGYALYLESGQRRQKTMVHVLALLGCTAQGPTTEASLAATPEAIRAFLGFLRRHGQPVDPMADFTTAVAEHVMAGPWLLHRASRKINRCPKHAKGPAPGRHVRLLQPCRFLLYPAGILSKRRSPPSVPAVKGLPTTGWGSELS